MRSRSACFIAFFTGLLLASCGGGQESSARRAPTPGDDRAVIEAKVMAAAGPEYVMDAPPRPCRLLTAAVARKLLRVRAVVADPENDRAGDETPRCAYMDAEGAGKSVSIDMAHLPYFFFNSSLSVDELKSVIDARFPAGAPYAPAEFGPGVMRFVAEAENKTSMFVLSGLGVRGADPNGVQAEAAFAVTITDAARTPEQRLTEARNLSAAYNSDLIEAAENLDSGRP